MVPTSHPSAMHEEWSALPPSCQEEPSVISVLFPATFMAALLGYSKFSPSDVPRVVCYCYRALQRASLWNVLPSQMCISPPVLAFTVKTKADVLAHFGWLWARGGMEEFPTGTGISHWFWPLLWHWPPQCCASSAWLLLVILDTSLIPHRRPAAETGLGFPVPWPQDHLPVH